jgi:hypothetical protein
VPEIVQADRRQGELADLAVEGVRRPRLGGAVTPRPANPLARIVSGKSEPSWWPVLTVTEEIEQGARRHDTDRFAAERTLQLAMQSEPGWSEFMLVQTSIDPVTVGALLVGAARVKAERRDRELIASDTERARARARRERDNRFSNEMARVMANPACGSCWECRTGMRCRLVR